MRIIVISDSHGNSSAVQKIVKSNIYVADMFVHLGDGENDMWQVQYEYPDIKIVQVKGNCDRTDEFPIYDIINAGMGPDDKPVKIFVTHGHMYGVNKGLIEIADAAKSNDCSVVLFGHTHKRFDDIVDGIRLINPGSCSYPRDDKDPSYAYVDVTAWGLLSGISDV